MIRSLRPYRMRRSLLLIFSVPSVFSVVTVFLAFHVLVFIAAAWEILDSDFRLKLLQITTICCNAH